MHTSRADLPLQAFGGHEGRTADTSARATTAGHAAHAVDDLPQLWDGFAKLVRAGLGITAFGVQIMDLPPDYATEAHDESDTGQQELYVALRGAGAVVIGDERLALDPEHLVRVDAGTDRVLASGPDGLRVLCVGAVPGAAYEPPGWTG
jgi:mannose-6-phosphate isomerase-like protein (cupin superfamily)